MSNVLVENCCFSLSPSLEVAVALARLLSDAFVATWSKGQDSAAAREDSHVSPRPVQCMHLTVLPSSC